MTKTKTKPASDHVEHEKSTIAVPALAALLTVKTAWSNGIRQPMITMMMSPSLPWRAANAGLLLLAARVEMATPAGETWVVQVLHGTVGCRHAVYLELADDSDREFQAAMKTLESLI